MRSPTAHFIRLAFQLCICPFNCVAKKVSTLAQTWQDIFKWIDFLLFYISTEIQAHVSFGFWYRCLLAFSLSLSFYFTIEESAYVFFCLVPRHPPQTQSRRPSSRACHPQRHATSSAVLCFSWAPSSSIPTTPSSSMEGRRRSF